MYKIDQIVKYRLFKTMMFFLIAGTVVDISKGATVIVSDHHPDNFVLAAGRGDTTTMRNLLETGIDINAVDRRGITAVLAATISNSVPTLIWLIDHGANIDSFGPAHKPIDYTPFLYAGASGFDEILNVLIPLKPNVKLLNGYGGNALIPACEKGHLSTVKILLERTEVDVNLINNLGWTALLEAIVLSDGGTIQQEIVSLLLVNGANPNIADLNGITPLQHAKKKGYKEIVEILENALNETGLPGAK